MSRLRRSMAVDMLNLGRKNVVVLVGIQFDGRAEELLDWAMKKVAGPGDSVVAIHVSRNSGCVSDERALLDIYLKGHQDLCNKKQVALISQVVKGNSIRKAVVREAKKHSASAVILGAITGVAKYCIKRLPLTTEVMAIYNGKLIFSNNFKVQGNELEVLGTSKCSYDGRESTINWRDEDLNLNPVGTPHKRASASLSTISLPVEDFTKQRPGWPLLQTSSSTTLPVQEARKMSVVKWVMNLPRRSLSEVSESTSAEDPLGRDCIRSANMYRRDKLGSQQEQRRDLELLTPGCTVFNYHLLKISTCNFSTGNLIGKGGCNSVYKGILPDGKPVAVKILELTKEARKDFMREIDIMTTLQHKRITPLLGICIEDNKLISVYDFVCKGSLEENLDNNRKRHCVLQWQVRFKIALGIAEALNYLHSKCSKPIIHRDVKSSNILLTGELEPQLCDFGLAIWGPTTTSFLMDSDIVGTFGYLAPEYFMHGKVSDKIDVYALGVVLLELLSGRRPIGMKGTKGEESLVMWAKPKLESGDVRSILDPNLNGNVDEGEMQRMGVAAKLCLNQAARLRPKMSKILRILEGGNEVQYESEEEEEEEDDDDDDEEVYGDSCAESHINLALHDINDSSTTFSSSSETEQSSPTSI